MAAILKNNPIATYYSNCEADIQGWVDFEKELFPIIDLFSTIFEKCSDCYV